ncbi:hypothetical protein AMATHDRAFT_8987 [Amanita thiersii Skay4041]|uniref:Hydrophobin n=1 Tax=Amanita thiersii Skay4041 TaxID=703135 RepID=A0A2A9NBC1_9AGAR|nr:hypothetical protein AMATHDRAFT_8987 [Amanita thiersii Skay4041]
MYAARLALFTLPALAAANAIRRGGDGGGSGQCDSGTLQCCNQTQDVKDADDSTLNLLKSVGVNVSDLTGLIGLNCVPISLLGVGVDSCSSQSVCCTNNYFNGLINIGCTNVVL